MIVFESSFPQKEGVSLKVLCFSDFHQNQVHLPIHNPDLIILLGDIYWRDVALIDRAYSCPKIGVLGNHDRRDTFKGTDIQNIHEKCVEIGGRTFSGFEGSPRYTNKDLPQYTESQARRWMGACPRVDVFIAHSNPTNVWRSGEDITHRGFQCFSDYILEKEPKWFLHGHLHEEYSVKIEGTTIHSIYLLKELDL